MAGEKTEKATPKKREDARKKGQVLKSAEVNTAVTMSAMFGVLMLAGGYMIRGMLKILTLYLSENLGKPVTIISVPQFMQDAILTMLGVVAPMLGVALVAGVVVNIAQVGMMFTTKPLMPKFSKINPLSGLKRIFSMRSLVEMIKAIAKIAVVGMVVYQEYMSRFDSFPGLMNLPLLQAGSVIFDICLSVALKASIALVAIGVVDYMYQWWDYEKNLKMTKQEVKDEYKQIEGDPQVKGQIKQKQKEMAMSRMMGAVPEADVVITNPTHYAIALKYDEEVAAAPVVIAKGKDKVAERIKEKAREAGIEMVENKPVAQALYAAVDIGKQIPEELFQVVAEILAFVYKKKMGR